MALASSYFLDPLPAMPPRDPVPANAKPPSAELKATEQPTGVATDFHGSCLRPEAGALSE